MFEEAQKRNPTKISLSLYLSPHFLWCLNYLGRPNLDIKSRIVNAWKIGQVSRARNLATLSRKTFNKIVVLSHKRPNVF